MCPGLTTSPAMTGKVPTDHDKPRGVSGGAWDRAQAGTDSPGDSAGNSPSSSRKPGTARYWRRCRTGAGPEIRSCSRTRDTPPRHGPPSAEQPKARRWMRPLPRRELKIACDLDLADGRPQRPVGRPACPHKPDSVPDIPPVTPQVGLVPRADKGCRTVGW